MLNRIVSRDFFVSLGFKLYSIVILCILLVSIMIGHFAVSARSADILKEQSKKAQDVSNKVKGLILGQVLERDLASIEDSLFSIMSDENILSAAYVNEDNITTIKLHREGNKIVPSYSRDRIDFNISAIPEDTASVVAALSYDVAHKYGVYIELDNSKILDLLATIKRDVFYVAVASGLISILIVTFLLRGILKDTESLSEFATNLAGCKGQSAPEAKSTIELSRLSKAMSYASTQIYTQANEIQRSKDALLDTNTNLEQKVKEQTQKMLFQEQLLIQQSKLAAMGEMISAIAHQWRQPLNSLAIGVQDIKLSHDFGELDSEYITKMVESSMDSISYMSKTIDDFRNFFKPDKNPIEFYILESVHDALSILEATFKSLNITVEIFGEDAKMVGFKNEFAQVVLNLLSNAKDAIMDRRLRLDGEFDGKINIDTSVNGNEMFIRMTDNGGGVDAEAMERIFEPYFTTKSSTNGTGLGLYMSRMIIQNHNNGNLKVKNVKDGACFEISVAI